MQWCGRFAAPAREFVSVFSSARLRSRPEQSRQFELQVADILDRGHELVARLEPLLLVPTPG